MHAFRRDLVREFKSMQKLPKISFLSALRQKRVLTLGVILLTENLRAQNVGRELVFSAELCYNGMGDENGRTEKSQDHSVERCGL